MCVSIPQTIYMLFFLNRSVKFQMVHKVKETFILGLIQPKAILAQ